MSHTLRSRAITAMTVAALVVSALAATPAAAEDAPNGPPPAPVSVSPAQAEAAAEQETAEVVYAEEPTASAAAAAALTGRLLVLDVETDAVRPASSESSWLRFWRFDAEAQLWFWVRDVDVFDAEGDFVVDGLEAGEYRVEFVSYDGYPVREYWQGQGFWFASDTLTIEDAVAVDLGTVTLRPVPLAFGRIAGSDRYSTSVAISQTIIPSGSTAPVVYLVTGANYADALSAGPAAARAGGVMLLTSPASLPTSVASELDRLDPDRIVIVGGTSVVSAAVERAARGLVGASAVVERIFGENRYSTSRRIVADAFPDGVPNLFIATGRNFPDALAAGPAASRLGGGVLLVDGALSSTDSATRALITRLGMPDLHLAGGTGAISVGVQNSLRNHVGSAPSITRYAGSNRYNTALELNYEVFGPEGTDFAFLATGLGFADALAGGPLAAAVDAPLYLSTQQCLRSLEYVDMVTLLTKEVYALGGKGALSDRVLGGDLC